LKYQKTSVGRFSFGRIKHAIITSLERGKEIKEFLKTPL